MEVRGEPPSSPSSASAPKDSSGVSVSKELLTAGSGGRGGDRRAAAWGAHVRRGTRRREDRRAAGRPGRGDGTGSPGSGALSAGPSRAPAVGIAGGGVRSAAGLEVVFLRRAALRARAATRGGGHLP